MTTKLIMISVAASRRAPIQWLPKSSRLCGAHRAFSSGAPSCNTITTSCSGFVEGITTVAPMTTRNHHHRLDRQIISTSGNVLPCNDTRDYFVGRFQNQRALWFSTMTTTSNTTTDEGGTLPSSQQDDKAEQQEHNNHTLDDDDDNDAGASNKTKYRTQIVALLEADDKLATGKAYRLFQEMVRQYSHSRTHVEEEEKDEHDDNIEDVSWPSHEKPDHALLEKILHQLLVQGGGDPKATALQAQTLISEMEELYNHLDSVQDPDLQPSLQCYHHLLVAWSKTASSSPVQVERVFWKLLQPDILKAAASSASSGNNDSNQSLSPKVIRAMLGQSLNSVLKCWALSEKIDAGQRSDAILSRLEGISMPKGLAVSPNPDSYHYLLQSWRNMVQLPQQQQSKQQQQQPILLSPRDVGKAARRVESLLEFSRQRYTATNNSKWLPDPECYAWLIFAYGYAGLAHKAQKVLDQLIQHDTAAAPTDDSVMPKPTISMYNHVLEAWARKGNGNEAGVLLSKWVSRCQTSLEQQHLAGQTTTSSSTMCQPDLTSCHLVIYAWGLFSDHYRADHAESILRRMQELQSPELDPHMRGVLPAPTVETYNAVLQAWSRHQHHKIAKACNNVERILEEMSSHDKPNRNNPLAPNLRTFELVIETYARFGFKLYHRKRRIQKIIRTMKHYGVVPSERSLALAALCYEEGKRLDDLDEAEGSFGAQ